MQFLQLLEESVNAQLRESNGKVNQTDRNNLRAQLMNALAADLDAVMTVDGAILEFEHEYWGSLCVEVNLKMKDPEYDIETAREEYEAKLAKAEARRLEAEKRAAKAAKVKKEAE